MAEFDPHKMIEAMQLIDHENQHAFWRRFMFQDRAVSRRKPTTRMLRLGLITGKENIQNYVIDLQLNQLLRARGRRTEV